MTRAQIEDWWDASNGETMTSPFDEKSDLITIKDLTCETWDGRRTGKRFTYHARDIEGLHLEDRLLELKRTILLEAHGWAGGRISYLHVRAKYQLHLLREAAAQAVAVFPWRETDSKWRFLAAQPIAAQAFFVRVDLTSAFERAHDHRGYYRYERGAGVDSGRLIRIDTLSHVVSYLWIAPKPPLNVGW